jgi:hypothetical protein
LKPRILESVVLAPGNEDDFTTPIVLIDHYPSPEQHFTWQILLKIVQRLIAEDGILSGNAVSQGSLGFGKK